MASDCVFCKIVTRNLPANILYQDEWVTAFEDIHPATPTHLLIIPNRHIDSMNDVRSEDEPMLGRMFVLAGRLANQAGIDKSGFRLIVNTGPHAGQVIFHLHMHLMGGQRMRYPIG